LRCRSSSGGVLGTSWTRLGQSCRRSGGLLGTFRALRWGISAALEASRRAKMAQDALECILGVNLGPTWITPWGARSARARAKRAKRAERRHAVPSRPSRCDRRTTKTEIRENREGKRRGPHVLKCYLFKRASRSLLNTGFFYCFFIGYYRFSGL